MIYRVLGVVTLIVGVIFALLTILVFLPFLSNFNGSLLILVVLFGIFAFVFLNVGWQLANPPKITEEPEAPSEEPGLPDTDAAPSNGTDSDPDPGWVMPSDGSGGRFAELGGAYTDLEGGNGERPADEDYLLHPHGTVRKAPPPASGGRSGGSSA